MIKQWFDYGALRSWCHASVGTKHGFLRLLQKLSARNIIFNLIFISISTNCSFSMSYPKLGSHNENSIFLFDFTILFVEEKF